MFEKPLSDIDKDDVTAWVATAPQESETLELKEALPSKGKKPDPWLADQSRVSDKARNELATEVIALANAHGGALVLGVSQTAQKPSRAERILPIPACVELADRMRYQFRDVIEPQIPGLEVVGVPTEEDGAGIVIVRCMPSRMAPHRLIPTRECYVRRADRTETMTMREIQDLTLQVERGNAKIKNVFGERYQAFRRFTKQALGNHLQGFTLRLTAVPTSPIFLSRPFKNRAARPCQRRFFARFDGDGPIEVQIPFVVHDWRPMLRGVTAHDSGEGARINWSIFSNGVIEFCLGMAAIDSEHMMFPSWIVAAICNMLCTVEKVRYLTEAPGTEYGLEMEIVVHGQPLPVSGYGGSAFRNLGHFDVGEHLFPIYAIYETDEFPKLVAAIEEDFWNAAGTDWEHEIHVDFAAALAEARP